MSFRLLLSALLIAPMIASAEIYRWKDANGNWQYGDRAPDHHHESVNVTPPEKLGQGKSVHDIHQRTLRLRESEQTKRDAEKAQAEKRRNAIKPHCDKARKRLEQLRQPFVYVDEEGNERGATAEEVQADIKKTQQWIADNCNR